MPEIPLPRTTGPNERPAAGGSRLINAYAEPAPSGAKGEIQVRRVPGLTAAFDLADDPVRGGINVDGTMVVIAGTTAYKITESGGVYTTTALSGSAPGSDVVTLARNMASTPDIILTTETDTYTIDLTTGIASLGDPDLPNATAVAWTGTYFVWTIGDGRAFASGINATTVDATHYVTAEYAPDGLVRPIRYGRELLLMGETTTEWYASTGNETAFPFTFGHVTQIGLLTKEAIAGMEEGFPYPPIWVANDFSVRLLSGYDGQRISPPYLDKLIKTQADSDASQLQAMAYIANGHAFWALSSPSWTWVYDYTTGWWHERQSYTQTNWKARFSVEAWGNWFTFDPDTGEAFIIDGASHKEGTSALVKEIWYPNLHRFPKRMRCSKVDFDYVTGVGSDIGEAPIETDPKVIIDWSDDGGATFGTPLERRLGTQGERKLRAQVNRCGQIEPWGRQWRTRVSDPVDAILMGATMEVL